MSSTTGGTSISLHLIRPPILEGIPYLRLKIWAFASNIAIMKLGPANTRYCLGGPRKKAWHELSVTCLILQESLTKETPVTFSREIYCVQKRKALYST